MGIVEVESDDGVVRLRLEGFSSIERTLPWVSNSTTPVALRIVDPITEDCRALLRIARLTEEFGEAMAVENIVSEDEGGWRSGEEIFGEDQGLGESFRLGLHFVLNA